MSACVPTLSPDTLTPPPRSVSHEGKVIVAGFASRTVPHVATSTLLPRSFSLIGLSLRHYREADNEVFR